MSSTKCSLPSLIDAFIPIPLCVKPILTCKALQPRPYATAEIIPNAVCKVKDKIRKTWTTQVCVVCTRYAL